MSPAVVASWPELLVLLGGRQSARTLHFAAAAALLGFLAVHLAMVLITGTRNGVRAIWTGWHELPRKTRP